MTLGRITFMEAVMQAVLLSELLGQDDELAHGLGAGDALVGLIDPLLHFGAHGGVPWRHPPADMFSSRPLAASHGRSDSSSSVTNAEMNGRLSPSTSAWETNSQR